MEPFWPETHQFERIYKHDELQQSLAHDQWNACWPAARAGARATRYALEPQPERPERAERAERAECAECAELESIVSTGDMSTRAALAASK